MARNPYLSQEGWIRSMPQESAGFGGSKGGGLPEIAILRHRVGEHGGGMATRESGVIDCFFMRVH